MLLAVAVALIAVTTMAVAALHASRREVVLAALLAVDAALLVALVEAAVAHAIG